MKLRKRKDEVTEPYTRDGVTVPVTKTITTTMPAFPRNWNVIALRTTVGIVISLTLLAVVWSTWSIGSLLGGGIGFAVAVIFDVGWAVALLLEFLSRYDRKKRTFPTVLGWVLMAITMGAIFAHGAQLGNWWMAGVGAFVSLFAKTLWLGVMKHVNAELSEEDQQWVTAQMSAAQAAAALASIRRQNARTEQLAALELLAMEKERRDMARAFGLELEPTEVPVQAAPVEAPKRRALEPPTLADMPKSDAVRFVIGQFPELAHDEIAELLEEEGVSVKPEYVKQIIARTKPAELIEAEEIPNVINLHK